MIYVLSPPGRRRAESPERRGRAAPGTDYGPLRPGACGVRAEMSGLQVYYLRPVEPFK